MKRKYITALAVVGVVVALLAALYGCNTPDVALKDGQVSKVPAQIFFDNEAQVAATVQVATALTESATDEVQTLAGTGSHGALDGDIAQFNLPMGVVSVRGGDLLVADTFNNLIREISPSGLVARMAGDILATDEQNFPRGFYLDTYLDSALMNRPTDIVVDARGWIFIADSLNNVIRVIVDDRVFTFAGGDGYGHVDGDSRTARFNHPSAIAIGSDGSFYVADTRNHVIRRISAQGRVTTIAGVAGTWGYLDGRSNTALFNYPAGIAVSDDGTVFVADTGNHLIRVIERNGNVRTLAGTYLLPDDVNWEVTSDFDNVPLGGFADGYDALFNMPHGLALWGDTLIVADSANHRIRAILPNGETVTVAGIGYADHIDGFLAEAAFNSPNGVHISGDQLFIADTGNNVIRQLNLSYWRAP